MKHAPDLAAKLYGPAQSRLEATLALHMKAAGIPAPEREFRFHPPRRWRLDFAWPNLMLAVEVEGGTFSGGRHIRGKGFAQDFEKYNQAALDGWKVLRFTGDMIKSGEALQTIQRALNEPT
jgi:very-short-patch-repair endonuclease